jgi:PAS domain S-box-containing protein
MGVNAVGVPREAWQWLAQPDGADVAADRGPARVIGGQGDLVLAAFEHAPVALFILAPDGHFARANRRFSEFVGYTESELRATTFLTLADAEELDPLLGAYVQALSGELDTVAAMGRVRRRDGSVVLASCAVAVIRYADRRVRFFLAAVFPSQVHEEVDGFFATLSLAGRAVPTSEAMALVGSRFTIAEAARRTGLSTHTLRAWERRFGIPAPLRTPTHHRLYDAADLELVTRIRDAVRAGATHAEAARRVRGEIGVPETATGPDGEVSESDGSLRELVSQTPHVPESTA